MADRGGDTLCAGIVESHDSAVTQRELYLALTLLTGNLAGNRAVNLIGKPVLGSHGFKGDGV